MPTTSIQCSIVSAEQEIYSGVVQMIVATGIMGDLGITPGHAPLLTQLAPGPVRIITEGESEEVFYVSGGMLEVQPSNISILADTALRADDVDQAAAEQAKQDAEQAMQDKESEMEYSTAAAQLSEAAAQLRALQQIKKKYGKT